MAVPGGTDRHAWTPSSRWRDWDRPCRRAGRGDVHLVDHGQPIDRRRSGVKVRPEGLPAVPVPGSVDLPLTAPARHSGGLTGTASYHRTAVSISLPHTDQLQTNK